MLTIVDCGLGNLGSMENMLKKIGVAARVSGSAEEIRSATSLILPGVGAFDQGMANLRAQGLVAVLTEHALERRTPILGVCLGMQLMGLSSEEGQAAGLGWVAARSRRFGGADWDARHKVPHMGWNVVTATRADPLFTGFEAPPRFYFVHSYHVECEDPALAVGSTVYGIPFVSAIRAGNICGVQFHPEKSHRFGMQMLRNFALGAARC